MAAGEGGASPDKKRVINLTADATAASQPSRARASLFSSDDDAKLEEAEAGKIGSKHTTSDAAGAAAVPAQQPRMSAWPSATQPPAQTRRFKATWSKAAMPQ